MTAKEPSKIVEFWLSEIKASRKREERYRKNGKEIFAIYECDEDEKVPFNILYSNTETLRPALFSAQPRPIVERRNKDDDPVGKLSSQAAKRLLEFHYDTNREGYETLTDAMGAAVLDTLLPGRGMVQVKYDADFSPLEEPRPPDDRDDTPVDESPIAEYAEKEQVCLESVVWDQVYFGYAKKWHKVPWIAYEFFLTKEEVAALLGNAIATKLTYGSSQLADDDDRDRRRSRAGTDETGERRTARIYQIWDKAGGRKIHYLCPTYTDGLLKTQEDPLGLTGFFNMPRPMAFIEKSSSLVPTAPYIAYRNQATELNRITRRINRLVEALKVRAVYDGSIKGELERLFNSEENAMVPAEVASSLTTEKGFNNAIWFFPIDVVMAVFQQLLQARESCKQVIYEITGISDIIRGSTSASETATAQTIKNQWGTLRLKRMQSEVARYARDLSRMIVEVAAKKFSEETWASMTGLPFVTTAQRQQLEQQAALLTRMQQPLPPELQQQLAQPVWGQILALLRDDVQRSYRIDIETNSTVEPEAAEDHKAITELMGAIGQTLNGLGPLVAQGVLPFQAAQSLLLFIARRFRFGSEIEDYILQMQPPQLEDNGAEAQMQQKMMELDKQMAMKEVEHTKKQSEMALKEQAMKIEAEQKQREMDLQLREMELSIKEKQFAMQQDVERNMLDMHKQRATEEIGTKQKMVDLENKRYKTENVVNSKADSALGQGVKQMEGLVKQLVEMVKQQSEENRQLLAVLAGKAA